MFPPSFLPTHAFRGILLLIAPAFLLLRGFTFAQDSQGGDPRRAADRRAIDRLTSELIQAFEKRDAAAIAAHWTQDGEFLRDAAEPIRGRAAIEKGYAEFFRTLRGKPKLEIQSDAVRFPSADMAVAEVTLRLRTGDGEVVASARQAIVAIREGGAWKLALIREGERDRGLDASLEELEWLLGTWRAVTPEREVTLTYQWDRNKAFLRGTFAVKEGDRVLKSGTEWIGKDNARGVLRSWVFQSDGGFGSGAWSREGRRWTLEGHGVRADGRELTTTSIYLPLDPNTFTWQAVHQSLDGVPIADTPSIKVTKQKSAK